MGFSGSEIRSRKFQVLSSQDVRATTGATRSLDPVMGEGHLLGGSWVVISGGYGAPLRDPLKGCRAFRA